MQEMGYGNQPFLVVFITIPKTTTSILFLRELINQQGKKLNDSYEKLKAKKALIDIKERFMVKKTKPLSTFELQN